MPRSLMLVIAAGFMTFCYASADEDQTEKKLSDAKAEMRRVSEKAKAALVGTLKKNAGAFQKAGELSKFEAAEAEIKSFEEKGELPKSIPTKDYESELLKARAKMDAAFASAVKQYTKDGMIALAKAIQQEWNDFKSETVAGIPEAGEMYVKFVNKGSGLVMEVEGESKRGAALIVQGKYSGKDSQHWKLVKIPDSDFVRIQNRNSGLVLNIPEESKQAGKQLAQWVAADKGNDLWKVTASKKYYYIDSGFSGLRVKVAQASKQAGFRIVQGTPAESDDQLWEMVEVRVAKTK